MTFRSLDSTTETQVAAPANLATTSRAVVYGYTVEPERGRGGFINRINVATWTNLTEMATSAYLSTGVVHGFSLNVTADLAPTYLGQDVTRAVSSTTALVPASGSLVNWDPKPIGAEQFIDVLQYGNVVSLVEFAGQGFQLLRWFMAPREVLAPVSIEPFYERLDEIGKLERGWDSYDAEPISQVAIQEARKLLTRVFLSELSRERVLPIAVVAVPNGGVQIEWRGPKGHLEVEIGPDAALGYLLVSGDPSSRHFDEASGVSETDILGRVKQVLSP